jgi:competence protein ComEC
LAEGITESDVQPCRELVEQTHRTAREVRSVTRGDKIALGAFTFEVIWPEEPAKQGDNAESLCLIGSFDGDDDGVADVSLLFTGDAEREQLEAIASSQGLQHVDILKVGHHGSKNALTDEQLDLLTPTIALIGVGAHNRYGHPAQVTLDQLEKHGCTVYRSDEDGQVSCQLSASGISVKRLQ